MADLILRAGSATITPSLPGELGGYVARAGAESTGTLDDLEAALIVLESGGIRVAWLTLDAIGVTAELDAELRAEVAEALGGATLVIAASHTHSGPLGWTGGIHPGNPARRSAQAVDELLGRIGALARTVVTEPGIAVHADWATAPVAGVGANRLAPDGPHENTVGALALRDEQGRLRAVLFDFATHPTVLGPANLRWSADWPGAARAMLRAALDAAGPPVTIGFLQGAAGDVSTRFTRRGDDAAEVARLGAIVGAAARSALEGSRPLEPDVRAASGRVRLQRRTLPSADDAEHAVAAAESALSGTTGSALDPAVRLAQTRLDGARVQRDLVAAQLPESLDLPLTAIAIGDVAWVHLPVEPFASFGARIVAASPFAVTRVVGYANGYAGYLADAAAHASASYEALSSFFPADAVEPFVGAATDLLVSLSESSTATIPESA